ncbi:MAG TPA: methyltransferase domain-containing protein [Myxococcaceae bacterium]|nr:methyltransferase domain-containing protein [Myxococcaceae bacterium]
MLYLSQGKEEERHVGWDPSQYLKFADLRLRPAIDLLNRIDISDPERVYDLGAGTGNVTQLLKLRWPKARITGVDSSEEMLAKARKSLPDIAWQRADLESWRPPERAEVIYSNAALHWIGNHEHLFPALLSAVAPGGVLAVQMPNNFSSPSHTVIATAVRSGPWQRTLEPFLRPVPVAEPAFYFGVLASHAAKIDIWETEYLQVLEGEHPIKEWTKGTWLKPLLDALDEPDRSRFESSYADLLAAAYPRRPDGRTLFPFRRLFIVASAK